VHVRADDTLSRYGGEEIAILFASAGIDTAMAVVER
jgi:PleD family two-component response regulator